MTNSSSRSSVSSAECQNRFSLTTLSKCCGTSWTKNASKIWSRVFLFVMTGCNPFRTGIFCDDNHAKPIHIHSTTICILIL